MTSTRALWASFQARVCSLPPLPTSRMRSGIGEVEEEDILGVCVGEILFFSLSFALQLALSRM